MIIYRLQYVDQCFNLTESTSIPTFVDRTLVQMAEEIPCIASVGCFTISLILLVLEFYKLCFNSYCSFQEFKVRKLVSSRQNLNANVQSAQYLEQAPRIILKGQEYNFYDTNKFAPLPQGIDTPMNQRMQGPQQPQNIGEQQDNERNFQLTSMPVKGQPSSIQQGMPGIQGGVSMQGGMGGGMQYGAPQPYNPGMQYGAQQPIYNAGMQVGIQQGYGYNQVGANQNIQGGYGYGGKAEIQVTYLIFFINFNF